MNYSPKHIKRWELPESYAGAEWPEHYVFLGQHRDSDSLGRSNFRCALKALGGESETVVVVREGHWAVGWVEWIGIHESDDKSLLVADEILEGLDSYPVVNEDDWSELEYDEVCQFWERLSVRERAEYCREAGVSIFSARRDYLPSDDSGYIYESLRG